MSVGKIILTVVIFVFAALVIPLILLLLLVSAENVGIYVLVFGIIFFASIGLILALLLSMRKELLAAMEELKVQNAAIAYRLSKNGKDAGAEPVNTESADLTKKEDTSSVNLNPETSFDFSKVKTEKKIVKEESFDDFQ